MSQTETSQKATETLGLHLQGVGLHIAKLATEIRVGDVLVWNYGHTSEVVSIREVSPQFLAIEEKCESGKIWPRRIKKSRTIAWSPKLTAAKAVKTWQTTRFESIDALIEAAAQRQHEANLRDGGVFNDDGTRFSDIEIEREVAKSRGTTFVSREYAFTAGLDVPCAVRYIKYVGWTPAA